jgi:excisionase family DNA binding protein
MTDRLLTADEVAAILSVPVTWVRRAARDGLIPSIPLPGRYVRFERADIDVWISAQKTNGGGS